MRSMIMALMVLVLAPSAVLAQDLQKADAQEQLILLESRGLDLVEVLKGEKDADGVFAPGFLADVPAAQLAQIGAQLSAQFGPLVGVEKVEPTAPHSGTIHLRFERAIGSGNFVIEPEEPHRVTGLLVQAFEPIDDGLEKIKADLEALPGDVSALYTPLEDGAVPILSIAPQQQLAIGSTFKLHVLATLAAEIEAGERGWDDVVELNVKSFPSGMMQNWPQGTPVTLQSLASLMISISDNTATDQLIRILGRDAIERQVASIGHGKPERIRPFLTTLELFAMKGDIALGERFAEADEAEQRAIVEQMQSDFSWDAGKITPPTFVDPTMIDTLEWFASAQDLKRLMRFVAELDDPTARQIMAINPSLPASVRERWNYIGYKGGSEPGVLNLTWLLRDKSGAWHMLAMSWNNPAANVPSPTFELLAQRIIALAN